MKGIDLRQDEDNVMGAQLRTSAAQVGKVERGRAVLEDAFLQHFAAAVGAAPVEREPRLSRHLRAPQQWAHDPTPLVRNRLLRNPVARRSRRRALVYSLAGDVLGLERIVLARNASIDHRRRPHSAIHALGISKNSYALGDARVDAEISVRTVDVTRHV